MLLGALVLAPEAYGESLQTEQLSHLRSHTKKKGWGASELEMFAMFPTMTRRENRRGFKVFQISRQKVVHGRLQDTLTIAFKSDQLVAYSVVRTGWRSLIQAQKVFTATNFKEVAERGQKNPATVPDLMLEDWFGFVWKTQRSYAIQWVNDRPVEHRFEWFNGRLAEEWLGISMQTGKRIAR
jgi:hypothetical protein